MKPSFPSPQGVRPCSDNVQVHVPSRLWDVDGHGSLSMRTKDAGGAGQSRLATYICQTAREVWETSGAISGPSVGGGYGTRPLWPISDMNSRRRRGSSLNFPSMARVIAIESCF